MIEDESANLFRISYLNFKLITRLTESNGNVSLNNSRCTPVVSFVALLLRFLSLVLISGSTVK